MSPLLNFSTASSVFPLLGRQDVHVWYCDLLRYAGDGDMLATLLSGDEQARAARFVFERDRQRFILSHGLLRLFLARYLDQEPRQVQFVTGVHGKPAVGGSAGLLPSLEFSLSHSGDYAFMALTKGRAVGVDVEVRKPDVEALKLAQRFFAPGESQALATLQGDAQQRLFYRYWTAKEAYLKGRGVGLSLGLDRFEILFEGQSPSARVRLAESGTFDPGWLVQALPLLDGLAGALAVEGEGWTLQTFDATAFFTR